MKHFKSCAVVSADVYSTFHSSRVPFTCAPQVLGSASSVISLAGKLLVSRIQELALWNTFPEALQQLSSGLGKKIDMNETPARFTDTIEVSKVDQPKLMFKVNQLVVLRGLTVHSGGASTREVSLTIKQVSAGSCAPNCVLGSFHLIFKATLKKLFH